jgi:hypothetical protein
MIRTSKILKISGYVILGIAGFFLFYGIALTWKKDVPVEGYAALVVIPIAIAIFLISLSQKKKVEEDEEERNAGK